ncbi:MAG: hypothetical protein JNK67_09735 [Alphaproteobacteria bacterium]|nr:hypothetical protein [Alphaproteobacteria bacterium]
MSTRPDIVIFGSGPFAARILFDAAATAAAPVTIMVAGRNRDRLAWLRTAGNARAVLFGRPVRVVERAIDLMDADATAALLDAARPAVVVQGASAQSASVIARQGDAWSRLVAEGGLSTTAVFQALMSTRVARAVAAVSPTTRLINCCFPDVVNGMIAGAGAPVLCGLGNIAILSNAFAGEAGLATPGAVRVLAHYQTLAAWRRPPAARSGPAPRVWLEDREVDDAFARFAPVQLTPEPAIEISGASGVPLALAIAARQDWRGHVPGPHGLPGGYPVRLGGGELSLDLPSGVAREEAVAWNARFEQENGLVVTPGGAVRYTGRLEAALRRVSPDLAAGFALADLESVHVAMAALRARLQAQAV